MNQKNNLQKVALWQWGLITILAGLIANVFIGMQAPAGGSAAARGQAFGRGLATVLFVIIGIVLIVVDLVRRRRQ